MAKRNESSQQVNGGNNSIRLSSQCWRKARRYTREDYRLFDCDGVVEDLYGLLWAKNSQGRSCPGVRVPQTVIFKDGFLHSWYFFSSKERALKRKSAKNLKPAAIAEAFAKVSEKDGSGICGTLTFPVQPELAEDIGMDGSDFQDDNTTVVWHMDPSTLRGWIVSAEKPFICVLQKFLEPNEGFNSVIRASWSPQVCLLERRTNKHPISSRKLDANQRLATFEGAEHLSESTPIAGQVLPSLVREVCNNIVEHILDVSRAEYRVSRMVLNFKVHANQELYLLSCSSIRLLADPRMSLAPQLPSNASPATILVPQQEPLAPLDHTESHKHYAVTPYTLDPQETADQTKQSYCITELEPDSSGWSMGSPRRQETTAAQAARGNAVSPPSARVSTASAKTAAKATNRLIHEKHFVCAVDGRKFELSERFEVTYKTLLIMAMRRQTEANHSLDCIPACIQRVEPILSLEKYRRIFNNHNFLYRSAPVCQTCYQILTRLAKQQIAQEEAEERAREEEARRTATTTAVPPLAYTKAIYWEQEHADALSVPYRASSARAASTHSVESETQPARRASSASSSGRPPAAVAHGRAGLPLALQPQAGFFPSEQQGLPLQAQPPYRAAGSHTGGLTPELSTHGFCHRIAECDEEGLSAPPTPNLKPGQAVASHLQRELPWVQDDDDDFQASNDAVLTEVRRRVDRAGTQARSALKSWVGSGVVSTAPPLCDNLEGANLGDILARAAALLGIQPDGSSAPPRHENVDIDALAANTLEGLDLTIAKPGRRRASSAVDKTLRSSSRSQEYQDTLQHSYRKAVSVDGSGDDAYASAGIRNIDDDSELGDLEREWDEVENWHHNHQLAKGTTRTAQPKFSSSASTTPRSLSGRRLGGGDQASFAPKPVVGGRCAQPKPPEKKRLDQMRSIYAPSKGVRSPAVAKKKRPQERSTSSAPTSAVPSTHSFGSAVRPVSARSRSSSNSSDPARFQGTHPSVEGRMPALTEDEQLLLMEAIGDVP